MRDALVSLMIEFVSGTTIDREAELPQGLPILRNGPPGTFVQFSNGLRVSLPTDQIIYSTNSDGAARVGFGGMDFAGLDAGRLTFRRVRELRSEDRLSPERSHVMRLRPEWVCSISVDGSRVWP